VGDAPLVRIGALEGAPEYLFSSIVDVVALSDATLAVADRGSSEIRVFGRDGRFMRKIGAPGEGPGEFRLLVWMRECVPGRVTALDLAAGRLTHFDLAGAIAAEEPFTPDRAIGAPTPMGCGPAGVVAVFRRNPGGPPPQGPFRGAASVGVVSPTATQSIVEVVGDERHFTGSDLGPQLLGKRTLAAAFGDDIAIGTQDEPRLAVHARDGRLRRVIRWADTERRIEQADKDAIVAATVAAAPSERQAGVRERLREYTFPEEVPAFGRFLYDAIGNLWVQRAARPSRPAPNEWMVFSAGGFLLGGVVLPDAFEPHAITEDRIAGVWRDDVGTEYVWLLSIDKPGRGQ
jgi:hypothetical protein